MFVADNDEPGFQPLRFVVGGYLGRCPRLLWGRAVGAGRQVVNRLSVKDHNGRYKGSVLKEFSCEVTHVSSDMLKKIWENIEVEKKRKTK